MIHVFGLVAQGHWVDHTSQQGQGPTESGDGWVSSVGELGVGWFTNEKTRWFASLLCFLW